MFYCIGNNRYLYITLRVCSSSAGYLKLEIDLNQPKLAYMTMTTTEINQ